MSSEKSALAKRLGKYYAYFTVAGAAVELAVIVGSYPYLHQHQSTRLWLASTRANYCLIPYYLISDKVGHTDRTDDARAFIELTKLTENDSQ